MFKWLEENGVKFNGEYTFVKEYNPETKMLVLEKEETEEIIGEVNIFESGITHNIDCFENWQEKLMNSLIRNDGKIMIDVLSTESADSWFLEIYRHKTLLPTHEYNEQIILTNYAIVVSGEVKGDVFTRQSKSYSGCAIDELKEFTEWIDEQVQKVSQFNNTEHWSSPCKTIVFSDCLCSKEEYALLHEMFNQVND